MEFQQSIYEAYIEHIKTMLTEPCDRPTEIRSFIDKMTGFVEKGKDSKDQEVKKGVSFALWQLHTAEQLVNYSSALYWF